jgi:hypothetical protein
MLQRKLDIWRRQFDWLNRRYPKMFRRLWHQKADWCERTGRDDDGWWEEMVARFVSSGKAKP